MNSRGSVLILTFLLMTTATVILLAYLSMVKHHTVFANSQLNGMRALYISEAGLNQAAWYLLNTAPDTTTDGSWRTTAYPAVSSSGSNDPRQESFEGGTYTMWVEDSNGDILITSRGVYRGMTRTVHQREHLNNNPKRLIAVAGSWGFN
jgi:hypothetical protein